MSLSSTFPIPDADDTAVALLLLRSLGEATDASVLRSFVTRDGYFATFEYERHPSIGVNLHVLHALLEVPGYPDCDRVVDRLCYYIGAEQKEDGYWLDKWHISPIYATAHALCVFARLPGSRVLRARQVVGRAGVWLEESQNPDGSWGWLGMSTAEETAYALLALAAVDRAEGAPRHAAQRMAGLRYLQTAAGGLTTAEGQYDYPSMWYSLDELGYSLQPGRKYAVRVAPSLTAEDVANHGLMRRPKSHSPSTAVHQ
ncbi:MAG: hypothetical protein HYU75_14940 [Betaproteobacteria bacterium]|nr:hypothetical protein [Betaproteobacteria bacterium]